MNHQQMAGVIGGLGPQATVYFMERVVAFTKAFSDQEHVNMLILNHAAIPDRTAWILRKNDQNPEPLLVQDAHLLDEMGADFIVIPCNTAHCFYEAIQSAVSVPVVHLIEETVRYAQLWRKPSPTIGILATTGTIHTRIYQDAIQNKGLSWVVPDAPVQAKVMSVIYDRVKCGLAVEKNEMASFLAHLRQKGADVILLGCSELSVLKGALHLTDDDIVDSIDVLALETVRRAGKPFSDLATSLKGVFHDN